MKKLLAALLAVGLLAGTASGAGLRMGVLTKQNMSEEEFISSVMAAEAGFLGWRIKNAEHRSEDSLAYFDSLNAMLMALRSGRIDEAAMPAFVAEYVVNMNDDFTIICAIRMPTTHLALGFRNDDLGRRLREMVNIALKSMKTDATLDILHAKYLGMPGKSQPAAAVFTNFPRAQTIRVAVTGDLPPLDMISPNGTPVGYNTAVLAELGRRMGLNIELVNIEASARTSALTSGRVDAVFWYQVWQTGGKEPDLPDGVLLSETYYGWDMFMHLKHSVR
ncbi:MAG: transporter substrate-binding domain-containing protein [Synergistaceae bacterium]|nr:transporter substrate-binding domain-containing protein [Synergistaceae bacterium]